MCVCVRQPPFISCQGSFMSCEKILATLKFPSVHWGWGVVDDWSPSKPLSTSWHCPSIHYLFTSILYTLYYYKQSFLYFLVMLQESCDHSSHYCRWNSPQTCRSKVSPSLLHLHDAPSTWLFFYIILMCPVWCSIIVHMRTPRGPVGGTWCWTMLFHCVWLVYWFSEII